MQQVTNTAIPLPAASRKATSGASQLGQPIPLNLVNWRLIRDAYDDRTGEVPMATQLRWRREGRIAELHAVWTASSIASLIASLRASRLGERYVPAVVRAMARANVRPLSKLHNFTLDLQLPLALYLRAQVDMSRNRVFRINALTSDHAVQRWNWWVEREAGKVYLPGQATADRFARLASESATAALPTGDKLVSEYRAGLRYMQQVRQACPETDNDLLTLMEAHNLPGGYLVTVDAVLDLYEAGALAGMVHKRVDDTVKALLDERTARLFMAGMRRTC